MSPFEIFRRNLKPAMVVLVGLSMFAFVVLPAMEQYLRSGASGGADAKLAEIDGVAINRSRVDNFTRNHQTTVRFLRELAEETIQRGGAPRTPGFAIDPQTKRVQQVGINDNPSEFGSVRTMQLASEANKAGFELDDTAIKSWLSKFTDGTMSDTEIIGLLAKTSRNSMGQFHLYEQLRSQLLASVYQQSGTAGLVTKQQQALTTPTQQWSNFLKLNRQATVAAYGLPVQDFYEKTNANPSASVIQAVYEEGKERFPNRQSPEPAFRKRDTATFEFVAADMKSFIDREVEKLSDDEIRAEYEKQLKGGAFEMPKFDREEVLKQAEEMKAAIEAKAAAEKEAAATEESPAEKSTEKMDEASETKADAAKATEPDTAAAKAMPAEDSPAKESPAKESPEADAPAKADTADAKKAAADTKAKLKKQVDDFQKEIETVREDAAAEADADQSSNTRTDNGVRLVAFQDDKKEAEKASDEAAKATEKAEAEADDKAAEMKEDSQATETAKASDDAKDSGDAKADAEKADDADAKDAEADAKEEAPKVKPFEEVRDEVARSMVRFTAGKKLDEAMTKVRSEMRLYFNKRAIFESNQSIGQDGEAPTKPDLEKMAADTGLVYGKIGPHDVSSISDEPIASSVEMGTSLRDRGPPFTAMMYGLPYMGQQMPKQQLYSPLGTVDTQAERSYITWKIDEKDAYIPELDEVKDEVIASIRMDEARDLARAAADELVDKIEKGEKLEDLVPEDKAFMYNTDLGPFSWMQSFGFGGAFLGNVPKLDSVGEEFMEKVFTTEQGKVGVAANLPERVIYIVQPIELQPTLEDLRERFKQPRDRMMASTLGNEDAGTVYQGFFESADKRTGFEYQVPEE
ncbi:hypothetical protein [Planctomycetes bacterium K23_9]|uniref:Periplasmic folding chaperone n=1 Tax=Stieleria marina TaxID=1930275 RepID=A0A517NSJ4_9BACT|nr:hypothetical protein K239x_20200 [Planctomycetes bacterium K23_9]